MSLPRWFVTVPMLLLAAGAIVVPANESPEPAETASTGSEEGAAIFSVYCANCHGKTAKGDGPIAKLLRIRPTDLTRLDERGEFPTRRVYEVIDGRRETPGHGYRDMPIFGLAFQLPEQDTNQGREVGKRIELLVEFLESLQ